MTTPTRIQSEDMTLGRRTGALTPGYRSSLRTATVAAALLGTTLLWTTVTLPALPPQPWVVTLLAVALGGVGILLAAVAVIELTPTPGRLVFYEHGFTAVRPDHTIDLYRDGTTVIDTLPDGDRPQWPASR